MTLQRILVVDDEPALRRTLERALKHQYEVVSAADPDSAYQILGETSVDLVLLDLRLPHMAGDTFFLAVVRRWPRMLGRVILMSGDPLPPQPDWPVELVGCPVLHKPFSLDTLLQAVADVLTSADPQSDILEGNGNP